MKRPLAVDDGDPRRWWLAIKPGRRIAYPGGYRTRAAARAAIKAMGWGSWCHAVRSDGSIAVRGGATKPCVQTSEQKRKRRAR